MRKAFVLLTLLFVTISCGDSFHSSIPNVGNFVFEVDMLQAKYQPLRIQGQFVLETKNKFNLPLGYGGIIIGNSYFNGYCAFDAACPVEASRDIVVKISTDGLGKAVCPKCKTEYDLNNNGAPNGVGTEYLKKYYVNISGQDKLYVSN